MNSKQVNKIEEFLEKEIKSAALVVTLDNGVSVYKDFVVKLSKSGNYTLSRSSGIELEKFNLKTTALLAAKMYESGNFKRLAELKILDNIYQKNYLERAFYNKRYRQSSNSENSDLYLARLSTVESKIEYAKHQIASSFRALF
jgi:hypothetical protein